MSIFGCVRLLLLFAVSTLPHKVIQSDNTAHEIFTALAHLFEQSVFKIDNDMHMCRKPVSTGFSESMALKMAEIISIETNIDVDR